MAKNIRFFVSILLGALPFVSMTAQDDDMYFVPSKKSVAATSVGSSRSVTYSGSNRSVDEYNRRGGSYYQVLPTDSTAIDVIPFNGEPGVYPDSIMGDDFTLTRQMSRYDGYEPSASYWAGYAAGRNDSWGWHSPWYYSYYPWYDSWYWYDPWYYGYYGWYGGWYSPWYYGYYRPYGWYGGYYDTYSPGFGGGGRTLSVHPNDHGLRTSDLRYYDRRNYSSTGVRNIGSGQTGYRVGNVGSGTRPSSARRSSTASRASGTRTSSSSRPVSSYSSSNNSIPNTGSAFNNSVSISNTSSGGGGGGGGFSGGGGGGGGARSVGGGHGGGGRR